MDRSGTGLLADGEIALTVEDVALLERAEAVRRLIERERPPRDERLDLFAWVVWPARATPVDPHQQFLSAG
jgi:hypothetical protein